MLKKLLVSGAALAFAFAGAPAVAQQAAPAAPAAATRDADPALWVVKDDDTTIYLFGTIHVLKPGLSWFDEGVKAAFDKSDTLVLELIQPEPAVAAAAVQKFGMNPTGPALTEQLPADKRAAFTAAMAGTGMPAQAYDRFNPWFASLILTVSALPKYGFDPNQGAEKVLTDAATSAGKKIEALETMEQQLGFFGSLSQPVQINYLVTTIDQLPRTGEMLNMMVERWAAGDPDGLATIMNQGMTELPEVTKAVLTDRNATWANWVENRLKTPGTVFVAVGAGHLAGKDSVQDFLAKKKLKATRVAY